MDSAARMAVVSGDGFAVAFVAQMRGRLAGVDGRLDDARLAFGEAAAFYEEIGDARLSVVALSDLGHAVRFAGELDEALAIMHRTLPEWEHSGNRGAIANQLESIAFIAIERDDDGSGGPPLGSRGRAPDRVRRRDVAARARGVRRLPGAAARPSRR